MTLCNLLKELHAGHLWHALIGDDQVDCVVTTEHLERRRTALCDCDIPVVIEQRLENRKDLELIVNQKHTPAIGLREAQVGEQVMNGSGIHSAVVP